MFQLKYRVIISVKLNNVGIIIRRHITGRQSGIIHSRTVTISITLDAAVMSILNAKQLEMAVFTRRSEMEGPWFGE